MPKKRGTNEHRHLHLSVLSTTPIDNSFSRHANHNRVVSKPRSNTRYRSGLHKDTIGWRSPLHQHYSRMTCSLSLFTSDPCNPIDMPRGSKRYKHRFWKPWWVVRVFTGKHKRRRRPISHIEALQQEHSVEPHVSWAFEDHYSASPEEKLEVELIVKDFLLYQGPKILHDVSTVWIR